MREPITIPMIAGHLSHVQQAAFLRDMDMFISVLAISLVHTFVPAGKGVWGTLDLVYYVGHDGRVVG